MARKPMVTRTIQTTRATVLCLNIQEGTPFSTEVVLPRTYKDDKNLLKAAENALNTDTVKAVHISASSVQETLYGMSEQDFIRLARPMAARGKFDTEDTDEPDEDDTTAADDDGQGEPDTNGGCTDSWEDP